MILFLSNGGRGFTLLLYQYQRPLAKPNEPCATGLCYVTQALLRMGRASYVTQAHTKAQAQAPAQAHAHALGPQERVAFYM